MPATPDKLEATNGCDEDKTDGSEEERGKPISGLPSWRGIQWPEAARRLADKASFNAICAPAENATDPAVGSLGSWAQATTTYSLFSGSRFGFCEDFFH